MMFRKVMFWIGVALTVLIFFVATPLQAIPFIGVLILAGLTIYGKKDLRIWIIVISALMGALNLALLSFWDVLYWGLLVLAFAIK